MFPLKWTKASGQQSHAVVQLVLAAPFFFWHPFLGLGDSKRLQGYFFLRSIIVFCYVSPTRDFSVRLLICLGKN